jgi:hypothetical protein
VSKHHYAATVREIQDLVTTVANLSHEEAIADYGIDLLDSGKVLDIIDNQTYPNLTEWARANIELNNNDYEIGMENHRNKFDDE